MRLEPARPYSWQQTLLALEGWAAAPDRGHASGQEGGWLVALRTPTTQRGVVLEVRQDEPGSLLVTVDGAALTPAELDHVTRELTWRLALDLDTQPLHAAAMHDPAFAPIASALAGFHPPLSTSAFQAACWTVIRQRTPPSFAHASMERLAMLLGTAVAAPTGNQLLIFPAPADLDDDARPALLAATNNLRKVERLRGLADAFRLVDEEWLRTAPYADAYAWLVALPGLGPWSAEQVLWRGLGRYERVPWRDTGALAAVGAAYLGGLTPAKGTARELAEEYGWLQGLWLRYLKAYDRVRSSP